MSESGRSRYGTRPPFTQPFSERHSSIRSVSRARDKIYSESHWLKSKGDVTDNNWSIALINGQFSATKDLLNDQISGIGYSADILVF